MGEIDVLRNTVRLVVFLGLLTVTFWSLLGARRAVAEWFRARKSRRQLTAVDAARFARLEQAVETIAIEVERIAEAQRVAVKLLAERPAEMVAAHQAERETV